jgi:hypothetical protein
MKGRNRHCQMTMRQKLMAHLFPLRIASLKVGCCVEFSLQGLRHPHHAWFNSLQGTHGNPWSNQVHSDSDSFQIGVNNHASYCIVNSPHLLDDLVLPNKGTVYGINEGLEIWGKGTFRFTIEDDTGRLHNICFPNSLYIPKLKKWLPSPQHTAQMAADNKKWMGIFCKLLHFALVWRLEDCTVQHLNQHSNLLQGSFLEHLSAICPYI